jgi:hypothetical protein
MAVAAAFAWMKDWTALMRAKSAFRLPSRPASRAGFTRVVVGPGGAVVVTTLPVVAGPEVVGGTPTGAVVVGPGRRVVELVTGTMVVLVVGCPATAGPAMAMEATRAARSARARRAAVRAVGEVICAVGAACRGVIGSLTAPP